MGSRLIVGLLASFLVLATGMRPCAAMISAPGDAAHDCCDPSERSPQKPATSCELQCAVASLPFAAEDSVSVSESGAAAMAPPAVSGPAIGFELTRSNRESRRPPELGPPLFILHAAFLL